MTLILSLVAAALVPSSSPPDVITLGQYAKMIIGAIVAILILLIPAAEKIATSLGKVIAQPVVVDHDQSAFAHADIHQALALLHQMAVDLQRQIESEAEHRKESVAALQSQLDTAIRLLEA